MQIMMFATSCSSTAAKFTSQKHTVSIKSVNRNITCWIKGKYIFD